MDRQMQRSGVAIVVSLLLVTHSAMGAGDGAFDERVRPPAIVSGAEFSRVATRLLVSSETADEALRRRLDDRASGRAWIDLKWQFDLGMDRKLTAGQLKKLGLKSKGDGSYSVELKSHPMWWPLEERMTAFLGQNGLSDIEEELQRLGFRSEDFSAIREYLQTHDWERDALRSANALTKSITSRFPSSTSRSPPRKIDRATARSFVYQRRLARADALERWSLGLLSVLGAQPRRILISYLADLDGHMIFIPDNVEEMASSVEASLASGTLLAGVERQLAELRQ